MKRSAEKVVARLWPALMWGFVMLLGLLLWAIMLSTA